MILIISIYSAVLFFILSPNIFIRLPFNGSKYVVAAFHAILFGLILFFSYNIILSFNRSEGFKEGNMQVVANAGAKAVKKAKGRR